MKLHNQKSYMTSLPEGQAPRAIKPKVTQYLYFIILASFVAYLIYIFWQKYYFFTETGFVEVEKITISSTRGGRIGKINVVEGQRIKSKTKIVVMNNGENCSSEEDKRLEKLKYDIASDQAILKSIIKQIKLNRQLAIKDKNLYKALELDKSIVAKATDTDKINLSLTNDAELLKAQIYIKRDRLNKLSNLSAKIILPKRCYNETISVPYPATIYSIQKQELEVIKESESILTLIANNAPVRIDAYLEMNDHPVVMVGDIVNLTFPSNIESQGIIETILSSAYNSPERKLEQYSPALPQIRIQLKPINETQAKVWKSFDQMKVEVRGQR